MAPLVEYRNEVVLLLDVLQFLLLHPLESVVHVCPFLLGDEHSLSEFVDFVGLHL